MSNEHQKYLREHGLGYFLDEVPPSVNSETYQNFSDPNKGECNPNCPFHSECTPFFEEVAKQLEKVVNEG